MATRNQAIKKKIQADSLAAQAALARLGGSLAKYIEMELARVSKSSRFIAWSEKGNQVDQQLSAVIRTMKDVRKIGVKRTGL